MSQSDSSPLLRSASVGMLLRSSSHVNTFTRSCRTIFSEFRGIHKQTRPMKGLRLRKEHNPVTELNEDEYEATAYSLESESFFPIDL